MSEKKKTKQAPTEYSISARIFRADDGYMAEVTDGLVGTTSTIGPYVSSEICRIAVHRLLATNWRRHTQPDMVKT